MFRAIGISVGIVSLTILAWTGFHLGFGPLLLGFLQNFEDGIQWLFAFIEPAIRYPLAALSALGGRDLHLQPHWKHIFILQWLYFGASARTNWTVGKKHRAIFRAVWGGVVALFAGVFSGTVALDSMSLILGPVTGFAFYGVGRAAWEATFERIKDETWIDRFGWHGWAFLTLLGGSVLIDADATSGESLSWSMLPGQGLWLFTIFITVLALGHLSVGASRRRARGETRWQKFLGDASSRVGRDMLLAIGGATFLVLLGMAGV